MKTTMKEAIKWMAIGALLWTLLWVLLWIVLFAIVAVNYPQALVTP